MRVPSTKFVCHSARRKIETMIDARVRDTFRTFSPAEKKIVDLLKWHSSCLKLDFIQSYRGFLFNWPCLFFFGFATFDFCKQFLGESMLTQF